MKQYKAIFLDWDDTIGDFLNAASCALKDIYAQYDLKRFYNCFEDYFNTYHPHNLELWGRYGRDEVTKEFLSLDRFLWPLLQSPFSKTLDENELRNMALNIGADFLALTTKYFRLLPDAEDTIRYLAGKYPLTIVSNGFIEVQHEKIRLSGLADCFKFIVLSEEVGAQKPNPVIYQKALELNGLSAEEVVMVGDSWTSDIQGAINTGIDYIWLHDGLTIKSLQTLL